MKAVILIQVPLAVDDREVGCLPAVIIWACSTDYG